MAWDGRTPTSIASAIVYITVMLEEVRRVVCVCVCISGYRILARTAVSRRC